MVESDRLIIPLEECTFQLEHLVGGKNASLGELARLGQSIGYATSPGFSITTKFYRRFLDDHQLAKQINAHLTNLVDVSAIQQASQQIKQLLVSKPFSHQLLQVLREGYQPMEDEPLAVRSSAVGEDGEQSSFAGQQDTFLNVRGFDSLVHHVKLCLASLFNAQAISYRLSRQIDLTQVQMAIGVQRIVRSDLGSAGVAFTLDPLSGYRGAITINSNYGLGESVVGGSVNPDQVVLDKRMLELGCSRALIGQLKGQKQQKVVFSEIPGKLTEEIDTTELERSQFSLSESEAMKLGRLALSLEKHYQEIKSNPQLSIDLEWAKEPGDQRFYLLQARPETVHSRSTDPTYCSYQLDVGDQQPLVQGQAIGRQITTGQVTKPTSFQDHGDFQDGDLLVVEMTTPDWEPLMKRSSGVITDKGSPTCHAAIIARELGINALVGTGQGTKLLANGQTVTLACHQGETGVVYDGALPFQKQTFKWDQQAFQQRKVKLMTNLGNPQTAFSVSQLPNDGIGLVRMEFIISQTVRVHPLALLQFDQLSPEVQQTVTQLVGSTEPFAGQQYYVDQLVLGLGKIASSFYPRPIIIRFSDFKSNEYRNLIGGDQFEPEEENPMLGWRGCSRYYSDFFRPAFDLECQAIRILREEMALSNVIVMLPFCRTPKEAQKVITILETNGLRRSPGKLQIYLMCEIPSNVIEAEQFAPYIDGVSIGGNDLFQLTLGLDRDSAIQIDDHTNRSFRWMVQEAIARYQKLGIKVGFCGQQPSLSGNFARFLVESGIDSISVTPDSLIPTVNNLT